MATNPAIRKALLAKLDVTPSRLSQRAKQVKALVPMSTEQAHYVIAHEEGIDIARELPKDEVAEVRELVAHYRAANGPLSASTANGKPMKRKARAMPKTAQVSIKAAGAPNLSVITAVHAGEA